MASGVKVFYQSLTTHLLTTGSVCPSSRFLAEAITRCVEKKDKPLLILEAGPGTGPFTKVLAQKMKDDDILDLCELNADFVKFLQELCETHPDLCPHRERIRIHNKPLQELEGEGKYDFIVSGLPLNNFPPALVQEIFDTFRRLIKPGGKLAFFEYYMIRHLRRPFVNAAEKANIREREARLADFLRQHEQSRILVPLNFPPSVVYVCGF